MIIFRSFYRTIILVNIVLVLVLLAPLALASPLEDKQKELQNINAQIEATKDEQDNATKRQAEVEQQIQQSTQKMVQIQRKLNNLQVEYNDLIARKKTTEAKLTETQNKLYETQTKLDAARERLALRREVYNKRLVNTYKNGEPSAIALILSADDLSDLVKRIAFLGMIAEEDGRIVLGMKQLTATITNEVAQIEAMKKIIDEQRQLLIAEEKRVKAMQASIISQQKELEDEVAKQQQLYAQIEQEREQLAKAESQLKASSNEVANQIQALENQGGGGTKPTSAPADLRALAESTAIKYGIPPRLFFALIKQESGWNYRAVSSAGAIGLTQVMPFNVIAMGYDLESFKNSPADQLEAGAKYLSWQYKTFGRWDLALAAYNAGPGRVMRIIEEHGVPPYGDTTYYPSETKGYVRNILSMAGM